MIWIAVQGCCLIFCSFPECKIWLHTDAEREGWNPLASRILTSDLWCIWVCQGWAGEYISICCHLSVKSTSLQTLALINEPGQKFCCEWCIWEVKEVCSWTEPERKFSHSVFKKPSWDAWGQLSRTTGRVNFLPPDPRLTWSLAQGYNESWKSWSDKRVDVEGFSD